MTTSTAAPAAGAPAGSAGAADAALPPALAEIVDDFAALGERDRLQLLLELSRELPALAPAEAAQRDRFERVDECQSPLFLAVDVDRERAGAPVRLAFDAPAEAPTTRGFASILHQGLDGLPASDVLGVPDDFYVRLGLQDAVSPLRLRGMAGMLARIKRQVRARLAT